MRRSRISFGVVAVGYDVWCPDMIEDGLFFHLFVWQIGDAIVWCGLSLWLRATVLGVLAIVTCYRVHLQVWMVCQVRPQLWFDEEILRGVFRTSNVDHA